MQVYSAVLEFPLVLFLAEGVWVLQFPLSDFIEELSAVMCVLDSLEKQHLFSAVFQVLNGCGLS